MATKVTTKTTATPKATAKTKAAPKSTPKAAPKSTPKAAPPVEEVEFNIGFSDDSEYDLVPESKWNYPTMGYDASSAIWYIGDEEYKGPITIQILSARRQKSVKDLQGNVYCYPVTTRSADMIQGVDKPKTHVQFIFRIPELETEENPFAAFLFGSKSYSTIAAFWNPSKGTYHDDRFSSGIWYQLSEWVKEIEDKYNRKVPFYAWNITVNPEEEPFKITAATGKGSSMIHRLFIDQITLGSYIGDNQAFRNKDFIKDEDLQEWADQWNKNTSIVEMEIDPDAEEWEEEEESEYDEL